MRCGRLNRRQQPRHMNAKNSPLHYQPQYLPLVPGLKLAKDVSRISAARISTERFAIRRIATERFATKRSATERSAIRRSATKRITTERIVTERITTKRIATKRIRVNRMATDRISNSENFPPSLASGVLTTSEAAPFSIATNLGSLLKQSQPNTAAERNSDRNIRSLC